MTLANKVLQRLAEWQPPNGRQELIIPDADSGWSVALTADRRDELGCLVWELALRRPAPAGGDLAAWAGRVAERVTSLLDPLAVVEIDETRQEGLLRTAPPRRLGNKVLYHEARLTGTTQAVLRRYQAAEDGKVRREQVAFALTDEALARLAEDLTGG